MVKASKTVNEDTKWVFVKKGTCSRALFYILNREFDHPMELEEKGVDLLAGGILQQGYQCGLLWGTAMGIGAEASRRSNDQGGAMGLAISTTKSTVEAFEKMAKSIECHEITKADFKNKLSFAKYMITGKFISCYKLADKWAPEAIRLTKEGLSAERHDYTQKPISCASEIAKKMGANNEQMVIVAGLAGGLGLSGNACGALATAIWIKMMDWYKENPKRSPISNPAAEKILQAFLQETEYEFLCSEICGKRFSNIDEHTEYMKGGGCEKLINVLAES